MSIVCRYVKHNLNREQFQKEVICYLNHYMKDTYARMFDATVFESSRRHPTEVKFLR